MSDHSAPRRRRSRPGPARIPHLCHGATGAVGAAFAAVPFIASWSPSERARAAGAPVEVDVWPRSSQARC